MFRIETRVQMRHYLEQGLSKAVTARLLGISRKTIYNRIQAGEFERDPEDTTVEFGPRAPRPTKIYPYRIYIARRLSDYPQLTAAPPLQGGRGRLVPRRLRSGQGLRPGTPGGRGERRAARFRR